MPVDVFCRKKLQDLQSRIEKADLGVMAYMTFLWVMA